MRQSQHGKKPRGRGRKPHNPLSRVYDSSGPDVKIRGSASHIADKYLNLARDAHSAGDRIAAENYLQHAEHYLRIIAAAQAQMGAIAVQANEQPSGDEFDDQPGDGDSERFGEASPRQAQPQPQYQPQSQPQAQPQPQSQPQGQPQGQPQAQGEGRSRRGGRRRNGARGFDGETPEFMAGTDQDDGDADRQPAHQPANGAGRAAGGGAGEHAPFTPASEAEQDAADAGDASDDAVETALSSTDPLSA